MTRNTEDGHTEERPALESPTAERSTTEQRAENAARLLRQLAALVPDAVEADRSVRGEAAADIRAARCQEVFRALRDDESLSFDLLVDLTVVDGLGTAPTSSRFTVVYHLMSSARGHRLRLRVAAVGEAPSVPSCTAIWAAAVWLEREAFDLYGLQFEGHPDLRRLLLPDDYVGHPLRRDFAKQPAPVVVSEPLPWES